MPDIDIPKVTWARPLSEVIKRRRSATEFSIAIDYDGHDTIDLTPSHRIPEVLSSETKSPQKATPIPASNASNVALVPTNKPNEKTDAVSKWHPEEWDADRFDSDDQNMSLVLTMDLAHHLSLLKEHLGMYRQFNVRLGGAVSGPRHRGFISNIFSTVARIESYTTRLRDLRDEKQRGNPEPSTLELVAEKISRKCRSRGEYLWDVMEEKVDMTNEEEKAPWVKKKKAVLVDVMEGMARYLGELGKEEGWREVRDMQRGWDKRWKTYGAMDTEDLKKAGWILDVVK